MLSGQFHSMDGLSPMKAPAVSNEQGALLGRDGENKNLVRLSGIEQEIPRFTALLLHLLC
jgi:hypothetical protein